MKLKMNCHSNIYILDAWAQSLVLKTTILDEIYYTYYYTQLFSQRRVKLFLFSQVVVLESY